MDRKTPIFSIIVPTYNRLKSLSFCLQSLARLDYPRDQYEVIIVDDGSPRSVKDTVDPFRHRLNITLLAQTHEGPARARNKGAKQAEGRYLTFTDDDCMPAPDWLQCLSKRFAEAPNHAIGGKTLNAIPSNPYSTASQLLIDYLYTYYDSDHREARFIPSNNLSLPSHLFHAVGGFDTSFPRAAGEDRELCVRWLKHGYGIIYAPEVLVYHTHALRFSTFLGQHFNYGRGAFQFHWSFDCYNPKHFWIEPLPFYLNILRYPFLQVKGWRAIQFSILITVSQGANAAGYFWDWIKQNKKRSR